MLPFHRIQTAIGIEIVIVVLVPLIGTSCAIDVHPDEIAEVRRWVAAKFEGVEQPDWMRPGMTVVSNYGPVQKNLRAQGD